MLSLAASIVRDVARGERPSICVPICCGIEVVGTPVVTDCA